MSFTLMLEFGEIADVFDAFRFLSDLPLILLRGSLQIDVKHAIFKVGNTI